MDPLFGDTSYNSMYGSGAPQLLRVQQQNKGTNTSFDPANVAKGSLKPSGLSEDDRRANKAWAQGFYDYLAKPEDGDLLRNVRNAANGGVNAAQWGLPRAGAFVLNVGADVAQLPGNLWGFGNYAFGGAGKPLYQIPKIDTSNWYSTHFGADPASGQAGAFVGQLGAPAAAAKAIKALKYLRAPLDTLQGSLEAQRVAQDVAELGTKGTGLKASVTEKLIAAQKAKVEAAARLSRMKNTYHFKRPHYKFKVDMGWSNKGGKLVPGNIEITSKHLADIPVGGVQTSSKAFQTAETAKNYVASYFPTWLRSPSVPIKRGLNTVKKGFQHLKDAPLQTLKNVAIKGAKATPKLVGQGVAGTVIPASLKKYFDQQRYQIANNNTLSQTQKQKQLQDMDDWQAYANTAIGTVSFFTGRTGFGNKYLPTNLLSLQSVNNGLSRLFSNKEYGTPITQQNIIKARSEKQSASDMNATIVQNSKPDPLSDYIKRQAVQTAGLLPYAIPGVRIPLLPQLVVQGTTGKSIPAYLIPGWRTLTDRGTTTIQENQQLLKRQFPQQLRKAVQIKQMQAKAMKQAKTPQQRAAIRDQANALRAQVDAQLKQRMQRNTGSGTIFDHMKLYAKLTAGKQLTPQQISMFGNQLRNNPQVQQKVVAIANKKIQDAFAGLRQAKTDQQRSKYIKQFFAGNKNKQLVSRLLQDKALSQKSLTDISAAINKGISNMSVDDMLAVADQASSTKSQFGNIPPQVIQSFTPAILSRMQSFVDNAKGQQIFTISKKLLAIRSAFGGDTQAFDKNPQVKKLQQAVQAKSWGALKNNPLLMHKAVSLWLRSKNMPQLADFLQQPFAFYGLLAVLIGAPLLMGFSAGQQAPQQQAAKSYAYKPITGLQRIAYAG